MTVSQTLKDRHVRGIQRTSQRAGRSQVSRKPKSLQALRKRATTEAGSAEEEELPKSAKTNDSPDIRRSRHEEELNSIQEKIESSTISISLLSNHLEKGLCPKTLRYNARANITPDEDFKKDINSIRKKAEQALVGALVKFHYRRVDRLKNKYRKLKQAQSRRSYQETNQSFRKAPARNRNTS